MGYPEISYLDIFELSFWTKATTAERFWGDAREDAGAGAN